MKLARVHRYKREVARTEKQKRAVANMELSQQVKHVVYWTNPLVSGGVFLVGLFAFFLVGLCNYSSISVVCYILILNLTVRLGHMHGGRVLGEMNVLPKRPLPVPPDHFVTEEQVAAHVGAITARLNTVRHLSSPPPPPPPGRKQEATTLPMPYSRPMRISSLSFALAPCRSRHCRPPTHCSVAMLPRRHYARSHRCARSPG